MKVITAVEKYERDYRDVYCFLAGGITNCPNWQKQVIQYLKDQENTKTENLDHLVIFNPRRENFPIDDPNASVEQITWEFNALQQSDIFSMYFSDGPSDQPICMYELGRNVERMQALFPGDFESRIVISCNPGYKRYNDVRIQMKLAWGSLLPQVKANFDPHIISMGSPSLEIMHASHIIKAYKYILETPLYKMRLQAYEEKQEK